MERSYLDYSMSVIVARALPDVRDGLKPVHRRFLYAMNHPDLGARPDRPHMKCARITGDVTGKYHPYGTAAAYDALARLAQGFSLRYPLVDGHGNFGSPDDPPAAERYCVTGDTIVRLANGTSCPIAELVPGARPNSDNPIDLKVLDKFGNPVAANMLFHSGPQPTIRIRTRAGYALVGTPNHPVLCLDSVLGVPMLLWRRLDEVTSETVVCISRAYRPEDDLPATGYEQQLGILAGMMVSEGWAGEKRLGFNNTDEEFFRLAGIAYRELIGGTFYLNQRRNRSGSLSYELDVHDVSHFAKGPLTELIGQLAARKRIPAVVWQGSLGLKRVFLQALFEGDGSVCLGDRASIHLCYDSHSEGLVRDVQSLLLEFGIASRIVHFAKRGGWRVSITNRRDARLFAERVNFLTRKRDVLAEVLARIPESSRAMSRDFDRWERLEALGEDFWEKVNNREAVAVVRPLVEAGYFYDGVASIEDAGIQDVYSVRVASEDHSFLAGGFVNHNTEARLGALAMEMLAGIEENTVDFVPNYTNELTEPTVLPARFPNLLVNGSQGIAVAMATNIPTHNLTEVINAAIHVLGDPDATPKDLMKFVKGPDFPTGAQILGRQGILDAYTTGRGSIKVRATAEIDEGRRGPEIIVTEIPYQTSVGSIAGRIAELVNNKQLDGIRNINDASAKGQTRLVIELKRDANANVVLNNLWKHTQLQTTFSVNMVALVDGVPRTLNLAQAIGHYVDHQLVVVKRRSQHRLDVAKARAHIVEGLLKALDEIDAIIKLIRGSADRDDARRQLMGAPLAFSEIQANYILDMPLARLTRLGTKQLKDEMAELQARMKYLEEILSNETTLRAVVKDELTTIRDKFGDERRTLLSADVTEMNIEDLIQDEEVVVVRTEAGYIKTVAASKYRTQGRGGRGVQGANLKEADLVKEIIHTSTHAYLLLFSNQGRVFRLRAHEIPIKERTARGTALINLLPLRKDESVQNIIATKEFGKEVYLFFATKQGQVKKTPMSEYDKSRREGFIAINLRKKDELVRVVESTGGDDIIMVTRKGQSIRFTESNVRSMGRGAAGVRGIRLRPDDEVVSTDVVDPEGLILIVTDAGYGKRTPLRHWRRIGRGNQGIRAIKLNEKKGYVVAAFLVSPEDEVFLVSTAGITVRIPVKGVSSQGRDATGVRVMNLGKAQRVASASPVFTGTGDDDSEE